MAQQRMSLWATEDIDEDLQDVDLSLAMGAYGQNTFDDGELNHDPVLPSPSSHSNKPKAHIPQPQFDESTMMAVQHQIAQQTAFAQIPDVVKAVCSLSLPFSPFALADRVYSSSCTSTKRC